MRAAGVRRVLDVAQQVGLQRRRPSARTRRGSVDSRMRVRRSSASAASTASRASGRRSGLSAGRRSRGRGGAARAPGPRGRRRRAASVSWSGSSVRQPQQALDEPPHRAAGVGLDVADRPGGPPADRARAPSRMAQRRGRRLRGGAGRATASPRRRSGSDGASAHPTWPSPRRLRRSHSCGPKSDGDVVDEQRPHSRLAVVARVVPGEDEALLRARDRRVEEEALGVERLLVAAQDAARTPRRARGARRRRGTARVARAAGSGPPAGRTGPARAPAARAARAVR